MTKQSLGQLEEVELRNVWESEASDFTPWLAKEENLAILGKVLDLDLELESQEKNVGPFRADILCKDLNTQQWVLIENQIEKTDHNHLGQLLTYAAGLKAVTIVWIAKEFTDEHRATLDWLNEFTAEGINFFGLEIELWKIGDSLAAPRFNFVSKPNQWTHTVGQAARDIEAGNLTATKKRQLEYWTGFQKLMKSHSPSVHAPKPAPQHWMYFSVGRANFNLMAFLNTKENRIGVGVVIGGTDAKAFFHLLKQQQEKIETEFGESLEWKELPAKIESHILLNNFDCDLAEHARWSEYQTWMAERLKKLREVFANRIKYLDPADYIPSDDISQVENES